MTTANLRVTYQAAYYWTCPVCGARWKLRHRPRTGTILPCKPGPEQQATSENRGCDLVCTSAGRRRGIAEG